MFWVIAKVWHSSHEKVDVKQGSLSEMMQVGSP